MESPLGSANRGRATSEHGIIGNLKTAALVSLDATVDFMCWPSLDSPTVFAALLDPEKGGEFSLSPHLDNSRVMQSYLTETNILTTRWLSIEGSAEVTDLMPYPNLKGGIGRRLIRCVVATRGRVDFVLCWAHPIVTGAGSGIGAGTARRFLNEGAFVTLNGRREH